MNFSSLKLLIFEKDADRKIVNIFSAISFIAFALIILDCAITGGGRWLLIGPFSLRILFGGIAFAFALPSLILNIKSYLKNPMIISMIVFVIYLGFSAYIGFANGNRTDLLFTDIKGFAWLFLVPTALVNISSRERLEFLLKVLIIGAIVQSLIIIYVNIESIFIERTLKEYDDIYLLTQIGDIGYVTSNAIRVFFRSCPFMIAGGISMLYFQLHARRLNWVYVIGTALCINAVLITYTRSLYGAAFVSLVVTIALLLINNIKHWKRIVVFVLSASLISILFIGIQQQISGANYIKIALARTFSTSIDSEENETSSEVKDTDKKEEVTQESAESAVSDINKEAVEKEEDKENIKEEVAAQEDTESKNNNVSNKANEKNPVNADSNKDELVQDKDKMNEDELSSYIERTKHTDSYVRKKTLDELKDMIQKSPIIGNGLGAAIEFRKDGLTEYFYYDFVNKAGVVGLILYLLPVAFMILYLVRYIKQKYSIIELTIVCFGILVVFLAISYFNPYMNAALGILAYSIAIACFGLLRKEAANKTI